MIKAEVKISSGCIFQQSEKLKTGREYDAAGIIILRLKRTKIRQIG